MQLYDENHIDTSEIEDTSKEVRIFQHRKGTLVFYLLDKLLQKQGSNLYGKTIEKKGILSGCNTKNMR